jgi:hypothetical protein
MSLRCQNEGPRRGQVSSFKIRTDPRRYLPVGVAEGRLPILEFFNVPQEQELGHPRCTGHAISTGLIACLTLDLLLARSCYFCCAISVRSKTRPEIAFHLQAAA